MKKLFLPLLAISFLFTTMAQAQKLGTDSDPIRQMLFANQSLKEQATQTKLDGTDSPFQRISDASKLADAGKTNEAMAKLQSVLKTQPLETRVELWTWAGLRELGQKPEQKVATQVLGVIVEVPMQGGYDTLAGYADGSARYLNFSGRAIFWDKPDAIIKNLCKSFIESAISASSSARPRNNNALPKSDTQITLLTRSGNYVIIAPSQSVMNAAAKLMVELINRTKEKQP
ncbi:MAG: hypothetical protein WDN00_11690 [Limisphaerales bacterium]